MRIAVFFVCLCSLLLGGAVPVTAGTGHKDMGYALAQYALTGHQTKFTHTVQDSPVMKGTDPDVDKEYFVADDVEDDDSDHFLAKKMKLLARYPSAICYQSILSYLCNRFKAPPPFWGPVSYKYILQRALRI